MRDPILEGGSVRVRLKALTAAALDDDDDVAQLVRDGPLDEESELSTLHLRHRFAGLDTTWSSSHSARMA